MIGILIVLGVGLVAAGRSQCDRQIRGTLAAVGVTWFFAVLSGHVPALEPLMRLQLGRTATLLVVIATCLAAAAIHRAWTQRRPSSLLVILAILVGWGAAHGRSAAFMLLSAAIIADLVSDKSWIKDVSGQRGRWLIPVSAVAIAGLFANPLARRVTADGWGAWLIRSTPSDWRDIQVWARDNTPGDAKFVGTVNRAGGGAVGDSPGGFRVHSRRPMWLAFDFDAMLWRPDLTGEIRRRMQCLEPTGLLDAPMARIDWAALRTLAAIEGIDFGVVPSELAVDERPVFRNEKWAIVDLKPLN